MLFAFEKGSAEAPETVASGSRAKFDLTLTVLESGKRAVNLTGFSATPALLHP